MKRSSDGKSRDMVTTMPGAGWDFGIDRHPYFEHERPLGPHYCVYNRRLMACELDALPMEEGYWLLRTRAALLHTGEWPLEFRGPDAEKLLDYLFVNDVRKVKPGRCGYGIACFDNGGLIVDGVFLRLAQDRFWYAQADGDFVNWARAHARGMDVTVSDPQVYVSQVQGPNSMAILADAATGGMARSLHLFRRRAGRFRRANRVDHKNRLYQRAGLGILYRTGSRCRRARAHLSKAGAPHGLQIFGLDSMNIRRIEAGILNAGSDFDETTTPYDVGLGRFVAADKGEFIGKAALAAAPKKQRLHGVICHGGKPMVNGLVEWQGQAAGRITCGASSPYLGHGIGMALMQTGEPGPGSDVRVRCNDGQMHAATLSEMPYYDQACEIPRGKLVDIPERSG